MTMYYCNLPMYSFFQLLTSKKLRYLGELQESTEGCNFKKTLAESRKMFKTPLGEHHELLIKQVPTHNRIK